MRFVGGCTQAEIGAEVGVTQMQVSRLLSRLLGAMQAPLGNLASVLQAPLSKLARTLEISSASPMPITNPVPAPTA